MADTYPHILATQCYIPTAHYPSIMMPPRCLKISCLMATPHYLNISMSNTYVLFYQCLTFVSSIFFIPKPDYQYHNSTYLIPTLRCLRNPLPISTHTVLASQCSISTPHYPSTMAPPQYLSIPYLVPTPHYLSVSMSYMYTSLYQYLTSLPPICLIPTPDLADYHSIPLFGTYTSGPSALHAYNIYNEQFLLFPQCFQLLLENPHFHQT